MRKLRLMKVFLATCLFLMTSAINFVAEPFSSEGPPVEQALVREGDFAVSLVEQLGVGNATSEVQAESMLASLGIAPRNGWIADYPMTPDIVGELLDTVGSAVDSNRLAMTRNEATRRYRNLLADLGLEITPNQESAYAAEPPAGQDYSHYADQAVLDSYYETEGPPVVTYFPPPHGYDSMYSWVPYPFWWGGIGFAGFFVLKDFDRDCRVVVWHKHRHGVVTDRVTNHVVDPATKNVRLVDPQSRAMGPSFANGSSRERHEGPLWTRERNRAKSIPEENFKGASGASGLQDNLHKGRQFTSGRAAISSSSPGQTPSKVPDTRVGTRADSKSLSTERLEGSGAERTGNSKGPAASEDRMIRRQEASPSSGTSTRSSDHTFSAEDRGGRSFGEPAFRGGGGSFHGGGGGFGGSHGGGGGCRGRC